jgi:Flp pilus assembly protein TadD
VSVPRSSGAKAIAKAGAEYRDGDYDSAITTLASATVDEDDYLDLAYLLGLCYARLQRFDEALLYLEQVVTQGEGDTRTLQCRMTLAYIYSMTGRTKLAEYELTKLVDASWETPQVCSALGHSNWKQGRLDEGLRWYAKALELDPESPTALNGYGYLLACADKDLDMAVTCCRKALNEDPGNPAYADSLGWAYFKLGKFEEAGSYLRAAAKALADNEESTAHLKALEKAVRSR